MKLCKRGWEYHNQNKERQMNQCHGHCADNNAKRLGTSPTHVRRLF